VIGDKLLKKDNAGDAAVFLAASLQEDPDSRYNYYANYKLAMAYVTLGDEETAAVHCRMALELNPEFQAATRLLAELETPQS
jgi:Tfp pilus assembly protein PilF